MRTWNLQPKNVFFFFYSKLSLKKHYLHTFFYTPLQTRRQIDDIRAMEKAAQVRIMIGEWLQNNEKYVRDSQFFFFIDRDTYVFKYGSI